MKFGGIGVPELLIILVVVLLIFGPKNLPKLGSALGRTVKNLREGMESAPEISFDEEDEAPADDSKEPKESAKPEGSSKKKSKKGKKEKGKDDPASDSKE